MLVPAPAPPKAAGAVDSLLGGLVVRGRVGGWGQWWCCWLAAAVVPWISLLWLAEVAARPAALITPCMLRAAVAM